jgi:hypothetical protein
MDFESWDGTWKAGLAIVVFFVVVNVLWLLTH